MFSLLSLFFGEKGRQLGSKEREEISKPATDFKLWNLYFQGNIVFQETIMQSLKYQNNFQIFRKIKKQ